MIRVAFYANQVSEAVDMIKDAAEKGYEVSANLMAVSTVTETEIDAVLEAIAPNARPPCWWSSTATARCTPSKSSCW